jgi:hypothetical protein
MVGLIFSLLISGVSFYLKRYLDIRPSWHPDLVTGTCPVFQTDSPASLTIDHENMAVYPLPIP